MQESPRTVTLKKILQGLALAQKGLKELRALERDNSALRVDQEEVVRIVVSWLGKGATIDDFVRWAMIQTKRLTAVSIGNDKKRIIRR